MIMKLSLVLSAALFALCAPALASQITLGPAIGAYTATGDGLGDLTITSPGFTTPAFYDVDVGTATFGPTTITAGPLSGSNFPVTSGAQPLSVTFVDGDALSGLITWSVVEDPIAAALLVGTATISSSIGDVAFVADFVMISTPSVDYTVVGSQSLEALSVSTSSLTLNGSSGEVLPASVIPEPPVGLLVVGALLTVMTIRRKSCLL